MKMPKRLWDYNGIRKLEIEPGLIAPATEYGWLHRGSIWLEGESTPHKVVVKQFREETPMDNQRVNHFETAVAKLKKAGAPVIAAKLHKHHDNGAERWVLITKLYEDARGKSAIRSYTELNLRNSTTRAKVLDVIAAMANAGYHPAKDCFGAVQTGKKLEFVLHSLDEFADCERLESTPLDHKPSYEARVREISKLSGVTPREVIAELLARITHNKARQALEEIKQKNKW